MRRPARATLDSGASVELWPALRSQALPGSIFDKEGYSAFENPRFLERLREMEADAVVLSGAETDICVLSTALNAIDHGFFVILAVDAMTSNDLTAHKATLEMVMPRYQPQIRLASVADILKAWN